MASSMCAVPAVSRALSEAKATADLASLSFPSRMTHAFFATISASVAAANPPRAAAAARAGSVGFLPSLQAAIGRYREVSALDRKRGKGGQQVVRVEHVHVHPGGKAIVGSVTPRPRGRGRSRNSRRTPYIASPTGARHFPWRSPARAVARAEREAVPVALDEESPPLPPARRAQHGSADSRRLGADPGRPDDARDTHGRDGADAQAGAGTPRRR